MSFLSESPLDPASLEQSVAAPDRGAVVSFIGTVRDHHQGRGVASLEYHCYQAMAEAESARIVGEAERRFGVTVALRHRIGHLMVGDMAVVVACAAAHRDAAFEATRWVIDEVKRRVPIWKHEHLTDGSSMWVDPTASMAEHG
ncbi:MAG TPA: molybdenum cofactor biosynthesis protein MoaE [Gemmatimonadales bacterium]|nr:molybdenum cofactor biosynthesis protein MoaE [Gemmatimonadales bacterium]